MANIIRSPFYVPKPADNERTWENPELSSGAIRVTTTQVKFYGQSGQSPTKFWAPHYNYNDASHWNWGPQNSGAIRVTTTQVKFYGQPGQAPTKRWQPYYNYNDASQWNQQSTAINRNVLIKVASPFVTRPWTAYYTLNDASTWNWGSVSYNRNLLIQAGKPSSIPPVWKYDFDSAGVWQFKVPYNLTLTATLAFVDPPSRQYIQPDDHGNWQWQAPPNLQLHPPSAQNPFVSKGWHYDYDQASFWVGTPRASQLIVPLLTAGGQPPTKQWHYDLDDVPAWQQTPPVRPLNLLDVVRNPFFSQAWHSDYDQPGVWSWQAPKSSLLVPILTGTPFAPKYWRFDSYDMGVWQALYQRNRNLLDVTTTPFAPRFWTYNQDDASTWRWQAQSEALLQQTPFVSDAWHYDYDSASIWTGQPRSSALLVPLLSAGGQPPTKHWAGIYDYDQASFWTWSPPINYYAFTYTQGTFPFLNQWTWNAGAYDDASLWSFLAPPYPFIGTAGPPAPPAVRRGLKVFRHARRISRKEFEEALEEQRPFTRQRYEELLRAQELAQKRAIELEAQGKRKRASQLERAAAIARQAYLDAAEQDLEAAQVHSLAKALVSAAAADATFETIKRAELRAIALQKYLSDGEEDDMEVILLLG